MHYRHGDPYEVSNNMMGTKQLNYEVIAAQVIQARTMNLDTNYMSEGKLVNLKSRS